MKAIKYLSLIYILAAMILSSCTIQKRHYSSGFYVDWNHSKHHDKNIKTSIAKNHIKIIEEEKLTLELAVTEERAKEEISEVVSSVSLDTPEIEQSLIPTEFVKSSNRTVKRAKVNEGIQLIKKSILPKSKNNNQFEGSRLSEKKTQTLAYVGFICSLAGMLFPPLLLIGLILSAIGLVKIINDPDKFKGMGLAIAGMSIGLVFLLFYTTLILISAGVIIIL